MRFTACFLCGIVGVGAGGREGTNTRDRQGEVSYHSHERRTVITQDVLGKHTSGAVSMPILMFSLFLLEDFLLTDSVNEYSKHIPSKETEDVQYDLC